MLDSLEHLAEITEKTASKVVTMSPRVDQVYDAVFSDNVNHIQRLRDTMFGFEGKNGMVKKVEAHDRFITRLQAWLVLFPFIGTIAGGVFLNYVIPAVIEYFKR